MATILVIDDSEQVLTIARKILEQEHEVHAVENWAKAFPYVFREPVDLVLIDVTMPGFRGDEIAKMLKEKVKNRQFKIVLFSAMDEIKLKRKAKSIGVDGYICKVFNPKVLRLRVAKFLKK